MMKTIYSAAISVAVAVCFASAGQAAAKPNDNSPATQARVTLEQVDSLTASIADSADWLAMWAKSPERLEGQLDRLDLLREDVNKAGRELQLLGTERESLAEWESRAFDEVLPRMQDIAANTEKAIEAYNSNRNHLWTTSFPEETAKIFEDAKQAKEMLDGYLKLAAVREQEQRLLSKR